MQKMPVCDPFGIEWREGGGGPEVSSLRSSTSGYRFCNASGM